MKKRIFIGLFALTGCFRATNDLYDIGMASNTNNNLASHWKEHPKPDPSEPQKTAKESFSPFKDHDTPERSFIQTSFGRNQEQISFPEETFSKEKEEFEKLYKIDLPAPRIIE